MANNVRKRIHDYWTRKGADKDKSGRRAVLRDIARELDIPEAVVEQHIAEWEAGKGA